MSSSAIERRGGVVTIITFGGGANQFNASLRGIRAAPSRFGWDASRAAVCYAARASQLERCRAAHRRGATRSTAPAAREGGGAVFAWRGRVGLVSPTQRGKVLHYWYRQAPDGVEIVPAVIGFRRGERDQFTA